MANTQKLSIVRSVLSQEMGWTIPIFLTGSAIKGNAVFRKTH
jgi:hypothetical protein